MTVIGMLRAVDRDCLSTRRSHAAGSGRYGGLARTSDRKGDVALQRRPAIAWSEPRLYGGRRGRERRGQKEGRKRAENGGGNEASPKITLSYQGVRLAGEPGFEPGLTESESVGLPLTYSPLSPRLSRWAPAGNQPLDRSRAAESLWEPTTRAGSEPICTSWGPGSRGEGVISQSSRSVHATLPQGRKIHAQHICMIPGNHLQDHGDPSSRLPPPR
jgi:hypothetical protein